MISIHSFDWEIHITTNTVIYWESIVLFTDTKNAKQQTYLLLKLVLSLYWKWNLCWHLQIRMGWDGMGQKLGQLPCIAFPNVWITLLLLKNFVYNCTSLVASWGINKHSFLTQRMGLLPFPHLQTRHSPPDSGLLHPITVFILFCPVSHTLLHLSKPYHTVALWNACSYIYRIWESYKMHGHSSKGKCTLFWTLRRCTPCTFLKPIYGCPRCPWTPDWYQPVKKLSNKNNDWKHSHQVDKSGFTS